MSITETISTAHPLRTMILRFDKAKKASEFETQALEYFHELHNRTLQLQERIVQGRNNAFTFTLWMEKVEELLKQAQSKFQHLEVMIPENPEQQTIRDQLKRFLADIKSKLDVSLPPFIEETKAFYDYDDQMFEHDQWMLDIAFPQFDQVFKRYEECSVDMVSFDRDLDDFKAVLDGIKRQEAKYYETMNGLIERYSEINEEIENLFNKAEVFDPNLL